ncbi:metallophosphoesterase [Streptomyces shenzhenensis]|uniref:metallophosphoesterase n=1 Tax=Streptomyces shenzhenensis TaxID=943815 RepID=UPI001F295CA3|nr:metallophosphoesterase [Streptomyces shenzhenensis]
MRSWRHAVSTSAALGLITLAVSAGTASAGPHAADAHDKPFTFAVIGDMPYGSAEIADFPHVISQINADPDVTFVSHLGDIKNGSTACSDAYFDMVKSEFDQFKDPLVYTVGDNEWTDCHRPNNGSYNPLERLAKIRQVFFPRPGRTLGQKSVRVTSQADEGVPENVRYTRAGVAFAAVDVVGSNNSMAPWTGNTQPTPEQAAEVLARTASVIGSIHDTFASARKHHDKAVTLMMQADMFDPTVSDPSYADYYAFQPIVAAIARESAAFDGPVYLFNGDSHVYNSDQPLAAGSSWLSFYHLATAVPNLHRVTVDGSSNAKDYLKVTVKPHTPQVLDWTRVPLAGSGA